jgi:hypothetical protein
MRSAMKLFDDKRLLYHIQLPAVIGAIAGLFVHWNIFQTVSFCISLVLLTHWLSSHFNKNSYDIYNNRLFGVAMLCAFALFYVIGFFVIEGVINYGVYMKDDTGKIITPILGSIHPRIISMVIVLLPLGPYILHLIYECAVYDKDNRFKPIDIATMVFILGNAVVIFERYKHGPVISGLVIAISFCIVTTLSVAGYYFAKKAFEKNSNNPPM